MTTVLRTTTPDGPAKVSNYFDNHGQTWDVRASFSAESETPARTPDIFSLFSGEPVMTEDRKRKGAEAFLANSGSVTALAGRALSIVARGSAVSIKHPDAGLLELLTNAVSASSDSARTQFTAKAEKLGVPPAVLIDVYIPAAARMFGEGWVSDTMSFADVTICTSRLQSMVRELDGKIEHVTPQSTVLMIILENAFHTLGPLVATSMLRRNGVAVRLLLGQNPTNLPKDLESLHFDAVMISASLSEKLETLSVMVKNVKDSVTWDVPVAIGGSVLQNTDDVKMLTGADYALNDPIKAAELCGLLKHYADGPP